MLNPCSIWVQLKNASSICIQFVFNQGIRVQSVFNTSPIHVQSTLDQIMCVQFVFNSCSMRVQLKNFVFSLYSIHVQLIGVHTENRWASCVQYSFNSCSIWVGSDNVCSHCVQSVFNFGSMDKFVFNPCSIWVRSENQCTICLQFSPFRVQIR